MKNFKLKIKLLLYGFPFLDEYFVMDNFELKKEKISLQTKIYANTIRCDNYEDAYKENLEMIGLEISKGNVIITEQENGVIKAIKEI